MKTLGEKIKAARKELNMTQSDLAQPEMTKSMLSQIENNQASPSMKSLHYLAQKLGKPLSYFLDDQQQSREQVPEVPVDEVNSLLKELSELSKQRNYEIVKSKLEDILEKYNFDKSSKVYADVLYRYGECLIALNIFSKGETAIREAYDIFTAKQLYADAAKAYLKLGGRYWSSFDYEPLLEVADMVWQIYSKSAGRDISFEIELHQTISIYNYALGNIDQALDYLKKAIDISADTNVYYNADETYRLYAMILLMQDKCDEYRIYIEKAKKFAEFTGNIKSLNNILLSEAIYFNKMGEHKSSLENLAAYRENGGNTDVHFYYNLLGQALYMAGRYEEALETIRKIKLPPYSLYKQDYIFYWTHKIYEGLIQLRLGSSEAAAELIKEAIKSLEDLHPSKQLAFAYRSLSEVYSEAGSYENAYNALKRAYQIMNSLRPDSGSY